ncbi:MAG: phosphoesterase [Calditrichaeota bacterium]|nr:phosphoesterase [Calditrichota bacterium]
MQKIAWLSDIHLNFLTRQELEQFTQKLSGFDADSFLIGGDIGEGPSVSEYLSYLESQLKRPIFFVLGNHDFYHSSFKQVYVEIYKLVANSKYLKWLPKVGIVELSSNTCLIGHGCWGDGRYGDFFNSKLEVMDTWLIKDFAHMDKTRLSHKLHELGDEAGGFFQFHFLEALQHYKKVLVLTHVSPFIESAWYRGHTSDDDALPYFACKAAGDVFRKITRDYPDRNITLLCGHTHSPGEVHIYDNLLVKTAGAKYGKPEVQEILVVKNKNNG